MLTHTHALTIEAELHKRILSLLYNLITSANETIIQLTERQIVMNSNNPQSRYGRAKEILDKYSLPSLQDLKLEFNTKEQWKKQVRYSEYPFDTKFTRGCSRKVYQI